MKTNYKIQNGCHNCRYCERIYFCDDEDEFYCNSDCSDRPNSGSILMDESHYTWDVRSLDAETKDCKAWDEWIKGRTVQPFGI